ncbi:MAG: DUF1565 domain-containing protein [Planctomycetes bacterium]|nr:DUF1565 domain-containing protein [Planctomycetota bacterium]
MTLRKAAFCTLALALALVSPLSAMEYYVDQKAPLASDDNPGTDSQPFKTISAAAGIAQAGDTVWIKAGTYRESLRVKKCGSYYASEIRFITFAAFGDDKVIIDGTRDIAADEWKPVAGAKNVFFIMLAENPGQVFVDGTRLTEAKRIVGVDPSGGIKDMSPDELWRTTSKKRISYEVTDNTPMCWMWDEASKRVVVNTGDGNPSATHKVEVTQHGVYLDPPVSGRPDIRYEGRGVHGNYIRLHGLHFNRIREIWSGGGLHVVEDCVISQAGGFYAVNVPGIVRRNLIIDSLNQAILWGNNSVLEDNLIIHTANNPTVVGGDYMGVLKANGASFSTIRNNVILETRKYAGHPGGPPAIWGDTGVFYNAIYGNTCLDHSIGIYVEEAMNYNTIAFNTSFRNDTGIGVRSNHGNVFMGNYVFKNKTGVSVWEGHRWPGMIANNFVSNWFVDNDGMQFIMQSEADLLGHRMVTLTDNVYNAAPGQGLISWAGKGGYSAKAGLDAFFKDTGEEPTGQQRVPTEREIELVKFRVPYSEHPDELMPMVGNVQLMRMAPSGAAGGRPYFWRQGDADPWSFGNGVNGPWSATGGALVSSYPNLPRLWANGGANVIGILPIHLPVAANKEEGRMGIKVSGDKPADMHPIADGWLSPSLPTVPGTRYNVSFRIRGEGLKPLTDKDGPIVLVQWSNDTGQRIVRSYILGKDDNGGMHGKLPQNGTFDWCTASGSAVAPQGATRVRFLLGLRRCGGLVVYDNIIIMAQ